MFPSYRGAGWLGPLAELEREPLAMLQRASALGDVVRLKFPMPWFNAWLVNSPALIDDLLGKHARQFGKTSRGYALLRRIFGNGLLTSEGEFWLRQRRIAQPAFHKERIAGFAKEMVALTEALTHTWSRGDSVELHQAMMGLTLQIVGQTLLSSEVVGQERAIEQALSEMIEQTVWRLGRPWILPPPFPTPSNRRFARAKNTLDKVVTDIIAARRRGGKAQGDLLDMLLAARDPDTGEQMTDAQLKDEVVTLFVAGHETVANALTWTLSLLLSHPEHEERARDEVRRVLGDRAASAEDLVHLPWLGAIAKEGLRLYPPIWLIVRVAQEDVQLGELRIPRGGFIFFAPWLLHRRPQDWPNPEDFRPERWLQNDKPAKGAYVPFISGPRKCIGDAYAMMEMTMVMATLLQRARFERTTNAPLEPLPLLTLRPRGEFRVRVL